MSPNRTVTRRGIVVWCAWDRSSRPSCALPQWRRRCWPSRRPPDRSRPSRCSSAGGRTSRRRPTRTRSRRRPIPITSWTTLGIRIRTTTYVGGQCVDACSVITCVNGLLCKDGQCLAACDVDPSQCGTSSDGGVRNRWTAGFHSCWQFCRAPPGETATLDEQHGIPTGEWRRAVVDAAARRRTRTCTV